MTAQLGHLLEHFRFFHLEETWTKRVIRNITNDTDENFRNGVPLFSTSECTFEVGRKYSIPCGAEVALKVRLQFLYEDSRRTLYVLDVT